MNPWKNKHHGPVSKILLLLLFICSVQISAQTFPACDGRLYYFAEDPTHLTLTYVDKYSTSNVTSTVVCDLATTISTKANALGANPVDNYLYFIEKDDLGNVVIRKLKSNCNAPIVCPANNNPAIPFAKAACFDTLGRYWVLDGDQLSAWDLNTCKIVKGPFTVPGASNDIVFNPWDCSLYTGSAKISLNGTVTGVVGSSINGPGFAMGLDGKVYAIQGGSADSMELTRYDLVTGAKATVGYIKPGSVNGSDMASMPCAVLTAKFVATPPTCPPSAITFTDQSVGIISSWKWDFGDGSAISTSQNPSHTFTSSGTYTVKLTVSATNSCIVVAPSTYTVSITVPSIPTVTVNSPAICAGSSATLTGGGASTYTWTPSTGLSSSSGTSVVATPTVTTTYTITGKNAAGCTSTNTAVVTVSPNPTVSIAPVAAICAGASTSITASGATTYTWTPATTLSASTGTSVTANPATTTTYTVTGSNPTGCTGTSTVVVTVNPTPITVPAVAICQGGTATLTASGATTYTWTPAATLSASTGTTVSASPGATITYTVTGAAGACTGSATVVVTVNPPCLFVTVTGTTICEGACGTITAAAAGGSVPYTFLWSTGGTGSSLTACPTSTTSYTVTVTDNSGITASNQTSIIVNPKPVVVVPPATICNGTSTTLTASGAITYTWAPATGLNVTTGTSVTAGPILTTTYTVTGTLATGCTGSTEVIVTVNPIPVISVPNGTVCPGGSTTLTSSGATTYTWSPAASLSASTGTSVTANPLVNTTYTIVGTANGCTATTTASVTIGVVTANVGPPAAICPGGSTQLSASGGTLYNWVPSAGLSNTTINNPIATPTVTTTYTVNVSNGSCSDDTMVVITIHPPTVLDTAGIDITCNGACNGQLIVIPAGGSSPYTYNWSSGCTSAACTNVCPGIYTVTTTDVFGCTASAAAEVKEPTPIVITAGHTNVSCFGVCDGTASVTVSGGTPQYSYSWKGSPVQTTTTATGLCAGIISVTATDANGCTKTDTTTIFQPTPVIVTSSNTNICPNTTATLNTSGSGGTGLITFKWDPVALTGSSISVSPTATSTYTITGTDINGCTGVTTVKVTINQVPVINVPTDTICQGGSTTLTASGANTYTWSPTTGLSSSTGTSVTVSPTVTSTYTVTGTNSLSGCSGVTTVVVIVNPIPVITSNPMKICPGDSAFLTANGGFNYTWSPSTGLSSDSTSTVMATPKATTVYTITGTLGGCTGSTTVSVIVYPQPVASFNTSPHPVTILNPTVYFTDKSTEAATWDWDFGYMGNTNNGDKNVSFTYPDSVGHYVVRLIVTSINNCIDTTFGFVDIKGEYTFYIPNTFTPNGDGTNDGFFPKGVGIDETDYDLWIFDRWGNMIWHSDTWGEQWDGRANYGADVAQIDTYVWKVHVREKDNHLVHNYIGHVNIVK